MADDAAARGEQVKFTAKYNARRRGATPLGQTDARWAGDLDKAALRPPAALDKTLASKGRTACAGYARGRIGTAGGLRVQTGHGILLLEVHMELEHKTTVLMTTALHRRLTDLARQRGTSMGELVRAACQAQYADATPGSRTAAVAQLAALSLPVAAPAQLKAESVATYKPTEFD